MSLAKAYHGSNGISEGQGFSRCIEHALNSKINCKEIADAVGHFGNIIGELIVCLFELYAFNTPAMEHLLHTSLMWP